MSILGLIFIWLMFGIASAMVASNRGGNGFLFFILGCIFGPLALICAFFEGKQCPFCKSKIHTRAEVCPKCHKELGTPGEDETDKTLNKVLAVGGVVIFVLLVLFAFVTNWLNG